jgi:Immunity protein 53
MGDELITWLQNWYAAQCDGDWEHSYGVEIATLDNPGWYVVISLVGTPLEGATFQPVDESNRSEDDWIDCRLVEEHPHRDGFRGPYLWGAGGPHNLSKILHVFREWVIQQQN